MSKIKSMSRYCNVRDLVCFMYDAMRDAFKGTKYEETYLFYHKALISMTDKDCNDWMRKEGILKRWILPELGMNDENVILDEDGNEKQSIRYSGRLFISEFSSLNK